MWTRQAPRPASWALRSSFSFSPAHIPSSACQAVSPAAPNTSHSPVVLVRDERVSATETKLWGAFFSHPKCFHVVLNPESWSYQPRLARVPSQKCSPVPSYALDRKINLTTTHQFGALQGFQGLGNGRLDKVWNGGSSVQVYKHKIPSQDAQFSCF